MKFLDPENASVTDEALWASLYGVQYTTKFPVYWRDRVPFLREMLEKTRARSVLDVGTNAGWNLRALREIDPTLSISGLEINEHVAVTAASMGFTVHVGSARFIGEHLPESHDLVMTSGVLIHVSPDVLDATMRSIVKASKRWVLAVEYPHKEDRVVRAHGEAPRAWARPYGHYYEEMGLRLVESGVGVEGYPDCGWWLMEKP